MDGPYLPHLRTNRLHWRGSSNQKLRFLSDRYSATKIAGQPVEKGFNLILRPNGTVKISGVQDKGVVNNMVDRLTERGMLES